MKYISMHGQHLLVNTPSALLDMYDVRSSSTVFASYIPSSGPASLKKRFLMECSLLTMSCISIRSFGDSMEHVDEIM